MCYYTIFDTVNAIAERYHYVLGPYNVTETVKKHRFRLLLQFFVHTMFFQGKKQEGIVK